MSKEVEKRIKFLRGKIRSHSNNYYKRTKSTVSDSEFDGLLQELEKLEQENPHLITPDSPTQVVGSDLTEDSKLVKHISPMLSIKNEKDLEKFDTSIRNKLPHDDIVEYIVEPKIDGVSVNLNYVNGVLKTAATRGNGEFGDDITANVKSIKTIPKKINLDNFLNYNLKNIEVRGEIFISLSDFENMNKELDSIGEELLANPRNSAAGIIRMKDSKEVAKKPLNSFAYFLKSTEAEFRTQSENLDILRQWRFKVNDRIKICGNITDVIQACNELEKVRDNLPYEIDGAVIKVNSIRQQKILGAGTKYPKWARAFKFKPAQAKTIINNIIWQVGRTGAITPVAELESVLLAGSTIGRTTLHNYDEIERKDIRINDTVLIEKGGDVIPKVVSVVLSERKKGSRKTKPPGICPSCHTSLFKSVDEVAYYCQNLECPAQLKSKVQHFVSRDALDIEAIAEIVSDKLIESKLINSPLDLFKMDVDILASFNLGTKEEPHTFGIKNAIKVIKTLEEAKTKPLGKWLFALGIPKLGIVGAQAIAENHKTIKDIINSPILNDVVLLQELTEKARNANPRAKFNRSKPKSEKEVIALEHLKLCDRIDEVGKRLVQIGWYKQNEKKSKIRLTPEYVTRNSKSIGAEAAKSVLGFLNSDRGVEILEKLNNLGIHPVGEEAKKGKLEGKVFVITGTLSSMTRPVATELINQNGGNVSGNVSKNTNYLLAGNNPKSKLTKANELGIEVISEEQFLKMISEYPKINEVSNKQKVNQEKLDFNM